MVDGCRSKLLNALSGVPQGSVLGPLFGLLHTTELFYILDNFLVGYAVDFSLNGCCAILRRLSYSSRVSEA